MDVIKRDGRVEKASLDKVTKRAEAMSYDLKVEPISVAQKVVSGLYDGIKVSEIDVFLSETAASLAAEHPDYSTLAARVLVPVAELPEDERSIVAAETEAVRHDRAEVFFAGFVGGVLEIAGGVGRFVVDRWRDDAPLDGLHAKDLFDAAAGAEKVAQLALGA